MDVIAVPLELVFVFFFSFTSLFFLRKFAKHIDLVDKPNARKLHNGAIPLIGGVSVCISIVYFLFNQPELIPHTFVYIFSIVVLVSVGVADDKYDISFKIRFFVQAVLSITMMWLAELNLHSIGDILGLGSLELMTPFNYFITVIAVIGAINAFNMVDGIDGLLGGLSIVTFSGLAILMTLLGHGNIAYFCVVIIVAIIPYVLLNLGVLGRKHKVFMGDAGSMLIGFTVIWLLLLATQETTQSMRPVTALWLIAVPLMDMASIMIRRIRRGDSPFKPDREHLHHIFQRIGFSSTKTLCVICLLAALLGGVGVLGEILIIPEYIMFYGFITLFAVYLYFLTHIWVITAKIKKWRKKAPQKVEPSV